MANIEKALTVGGDRTTGQSVRTQNGVLLFYSIFIEEIVYSVYRQKYTPLKCFDISIFGVAWLDLNPRVSVCQVLECSHRIFKINIFRPIFDRNYHSYKHSYVSGTNINL